MEANNHPGQEDPGAVRDPGAEASKDRRAHRAERSVALVRLLIAALVTVVYVATTGLGGVSTPALVVIVAAWIYTGAYVLLKPYRRYPALITSHFASASDTLLVAAFVAVTGGWESPFYLVFYVSLLGIAARYSLRETLGATALYAATYVVVVAVVDLAVLDLPVLAFRIGMMGLIGASAGLLAAEASAQSRRKDQARWERRRLRRALDEVRQIAYGTSHHMRTPIRDIVRYAQMTEREFSDELGPEGREYLRYVAEGAVSMEDLVRGLSDFVELGMNDRDIGRVDADEAARDALQGIEHRIDHRDARVEVGGLPSFRAQREEIVLLLEQLIDNATKFGQGDTVHVEVGGEKSGDEVHLWVRDDGIGIAPDHHERVFRLFERLHGDGAFGGSGIGLALVSKVVERHDGRVEIDSRPGQGTTVHVHLPADGPSGGLRVVPTDDEDGDGEDRSAG